MKGYAIVQCDRETCNIIGVSCVFLNQEKAHVVKKRIEDSAALTSTYLDILETVIEMK